MKKTNSFFTAVFFVLVISVIPLQVANADVGPKFFPFSFNFIHATESNPAISGNLLTCNDAECENPTSSNELWCFPMQCVSRFEPPKATYYKIEIQFSDKTRTSNVFSQVRQSADYNVSFSENGLNVEEVFYSGFSSKSLLMLFFAPALIITVLTEKAVAGMFSKRWNIQLKWIGRINLISLTIVWYIFPALPIPLRWAWSLAEAFVLLFEALLIAFANKTYNFSPKRFLTLSLATNLASVFAGIIIPSVFLFFLWVNQECLVSTRCNINDFLRWWSEFILLADYIN